MNKASPAVTIKCPECPPRRAFDTVLAWCLVLPGLLVGALTRAAETAYLNPIADTALLEYFPTNNFGGQAYFNSGTTQNYTTNRGLMKFDIAGALPSGAQVTSAMLMLEVVGTPVDGDTPSTFELHRALRDWGEGTGTGIPPFLGREALPGECTWTHRFAHTTNTWGAAGGLAGVDYEPFGSSEQYVYGIDLSPYFFSTSPEMVADVQFWLEQPERNFGWMLISRSEHENFSARRFASREDRFRAPILFVDYFVVKFDSVTLSNDQVHLAFGVEAGRTYRVESCDTMNSSGWQTLTNIPPQETSGPITVQDTVSGSQRLYRLVMP